ncbi:MAG: hypothetical protein FWH36_05730 [Lentimicrobiaceae bacterium]|nr:hypothetical protein [Lentimicrobiaceae bacterium]
MYKKIVVFVALAVFLRLEASAQDFDPPLRLELDMAEYKSMNTGLLGKNGLVLFFQKEAKEDAKWIVCHYDTNFQLVKMRSVPFEVKTNVCVSASDDDFFYAILQSDASTKANVTNTYILCYDVSTKKIDVFSFYHEEKGKILSIAHYGNIFVYAVYNSKSEEHVYVFNTQTLSHAVLYQDKAVSCEFQDAYVDTVSQSLWVVSKFYEAKKQTAVHLTQLDANGTVLQEFPLESNEKYSLNSCKIICSDSNSLLLSGNYLHNEEQRHSTRNNNSGIFTTTIKNGRATQMRFFEYATFESWADIHKRSLSSSYDISYFVTQNDSFVVLASDFYAPEYQQYYADPYAAGIGLYPTSMVESKLIGFKYQTACIFVFDKEGKLIGYNPFNYSGLLLKSVQPLLNGYIDAETNDILYVFGFNNRVFSFVYNQKEIVQAVKTTAILSASRFETINSAEKSLCLSWYGNNFIYSAYQRTSKKYNSNSRKNNKYVFGINKLNYR